MDESFLDERCEDLPLGRDENDEPVGEGSHLGSLRLAWLVAVLEWLENRHKRTTAHRGVGPGCTGSSFTQAAPTAEKFIWNHNFAREGIRGTQRGRILEWMYGVPWRSNTKSYDLNATHVQQVKSTRGYSNIAAIVRKGTRDAAGAILNDRTGTMQGKQAQTVVITPTDAPAHVNEAIKNALDSHRFKTIPENAAPPKHVRGLPGKFGTLGYVLTGFGLALTIYSLVGDCLRGDLLMALADTLGTAAGVLQLYALLSPGVAIAGVSAVTAGIALSGAGVAVASGVSLYRAWQRSDRLRVITGGVGVAAGAALTGGVAGVAASVGWAPFVHLVGGCTSIGVGLSDAVVDTFRRTVPSVLRPLRHSRSDRIEEPEKLAQ